MMHVISLMFVLLFLLPCHAQDLYLDYNSNMAILGEWNEEGDEFFDYSPKGGGLMFGDREAGLVYPNPGSSNLLPHLVEPFGGDDE